MHDNSKGKPWLVFRIMMWLACKPRRKHLSHSVGVVQYICIGLSMTLALDNLLHIDWISCRLVYTDTCDTTLKMIHHQTMPIDNSHHFQPLPWYWITRQTRHFYQTHPSCPIVEKWMQSHWLKHVSGYHVNTDTKDSAVSTHLASPRIIKQS